MRNPPAACISAMLLVLLSASIHAEIKQLIFKGYSAFYNNDKLLFDIETNQNNVLKPAADQRIPDGVVKVYSKDKYGNLHLVYEYTSRNGAANGPAKSYSKYGSVESTYFYKKGLMDGKRIEYFPDGKARAATMWREGAVKWREEFDEEGNVTDSHVIVDGTPVKARLVHGSELTNPVWITKDGFMGKLDE
jgi:antitoxin component YwqK of YwqJK toxin-antitoxin module